MRIVRAIRLILTVPMDFAHHGLKGTLVYEDTLGMQRALSRKDKGRVREKLSYLQTAMSLKTIATSPSRERNTRPDGQQQQGRVNHILITVWENDGH